MKRDAIEELFDYTDFAWAMIGQTVAGMPDGSITRAAPGSGWPALRDAFHHLLGSYDYWLHETLEFGEPIDPGVDALAEWSTIEDYRNGVRSVFRRVLDTTPDMKFYEEFTRTYDEEDGPETLSLADIFANLLLHERGHHGDFSTLFYQLGAQPPFVDYRMYVYLRRNPDSHYRPEGWMPR
jgi:uncharacterized damage-inducible protein DinB